MGAAVVVARLCTALSFGFLVFFHAPILEHMFYYGQEVIVAGISAQSVTKI
jgi:hypothetical protein